MRRWLSVEMAGGSALIAALQDGKAAIEAAAMLRRQHDAELAAAAQAVEEQRRAAEDSAAETEELRRRLEEEGGRAPASQWRWKTSSSSSSSCECERGQYRSPSVTTRVHRIRASVLCVTVTALSFGDFRCILFRIRLPPLHHLCRLYSTCKAAFAPVLSTVTERGKGVAAVR